MTVNGQASDGAVDVPVDIFGNPLSEADQRLRDRLTSDEGLLGSLIPDLNILPDLETVAVVAGNVVIGLAGAALIVIGAAMALSGTRAGRVAVSAVTKGAA